MEDNVIILCCSLASLCCSISSLIQAHWINELEKELEQLQKQEQIVKEIISQRRIDD